MQNFDRSGTLTFCYLDELMVFTENKSKKGKIHQFVFSQETIIAVIVFCVFNCTSSAFTYLSLSGVVAI